MLLFLYRLSPETFGYTPLYPTIAQLWVTAWTIGSSNRAHPLSYEMGIRSSFPGGKAAVA